MKIREYIQVKPAAGSPDPATYCPANGYIDPTDPVQVEDAGLIPNPILPADGWNLLASFDNNSPYTTTFDPSFTASSGDYAWDLGDGSIIIDKAISHAYLTTATRTVKLYGKGICHIISIDFNSDNIVGTLDLRNAAFATLTRIEIQTNASMTSALFPASVPGAITYLNIYSTGITGVFDATMFTSFSSSSGSIQMFSNAAMTGISFASSITGHVGGIWASGCNITGTIDLSMFTNCSLFSFYNNPLLTGATMPTTNSATVSGVAFYGCNITGTLDLTSIVVFQSAIVIWLWSNPNMTSVLFNSSISGQLNELKAQSCALGYSDFTGISTTTAKNSAIIWLHDNAMTAAEVNHLLVDLDANSVGGYTSRSILIGGSNADPDTTSGGYNGSAAKTSLEGKGFSVSIT